MSGDLRPAMPAGRHDAAQWRKASRKGRERGCSLFIAAEELAGAGIDPYAEPPLFKVYPGRKRTLLVQLRAAQSSADGGDARAPHRDQPTKEA